MTYQVSCRKLAVVDRDLYTSLGGATSALLLIDTIILNIKKVLSDLFLNFNWLIKSLVIMYITLKFGK